MSTMHSDGLEVASDPGISAVERELTLRVASDEDAFTVHSDIPTVSRYLLEHPAVEILETRRVDGAVVSVRARLPVGLVKFGSKPRTNDRKSRLTSSGPFATRSADGGADP